MTTTNQSGPNDHLYLEGFPTNICTSSLASSGWNCRSVPLLCA
ncbi:hypothetical protein Hdeb2414_s0015g00446401 [Helianthus debilis subsp. tardiflorus]